MSPTVQQYSPAEEMANSLTHGAGVVLAIVGLAVLAAFSAAHGDVWHIVGCTIFGATLVLLYTASTLYHAVPGERAKSVLRAIDHSAIYLLIAGTYTPFALVNLRGPWGWSLLGVIWGAAIAGVILRAANGLKYRRLALAIYVAMGWAVVVATGPMLRSVEPGGLVLLVLGGLCYTGGILFYLWHSLPYNHAIWHAFVLAGSACHFFAILFYVIPLATSGGTG